MNNGLICISVYAATADLLIERIRSAERQADIVEVRFDHLEEAEEDSASIQRILSAKSKTPWIMTFRSPEQGGGRDLTSEQRMQFWRQPSGVEYIDVEEDLFERVDRSAKTTIRSFHDMSGMPSDIDTIHARLTNTPGDIAKIAYVASDAVDTIPVWKMLDRSRTDGRRVIPIAMGDAGKITRILGLAHGAFLTYASLDDGAETAAGQVTHRDLTEVYRVKDHDCETLVFGVIGDPVSQSLSAYMHNPAFANAGINAVFVPLLVKDIGSFMRRMVHKTTREVELNFGGFSVTMPHKLSIMPHLDAIDPTAATIGAVNTVQIDGGKLTGFNTDAEGFVTPLIEKLGSLSGARAAVFGAGGAARAAVYALKNRGADVTVFARDVGKASLLADEFGTEAAAIESANAGRKRIGDPFDILVDATPTGMKGPLEYDTLFNADELDGLKLVYDLVTKPNDTPIIREAKLAGIDTIGGVEMLVAQGVRQFELWTGKAAPVDVMRAGISDRMNYLQSLEKDR